MNWHQSLPFRGLAGAIAVAATFSIGSARADQERNAVEASRPEDWKTRRPPVEASVPLPPVPLLVEQLSSDRFAEREAATRGLARSGAAAIPALKEAVVSDQPEVSIRALSSLEVLWVRAIAQGEDAAASEALVALDELSAVEDRVVRDRVEGVLIAHEPQIVRHSMNEIRRLGGTVRVEPNISRVDPDGSSRPSVNFVIIGRKWSGGEEGLRHVHRVAPKAVYFIYGADLPEEVAKRLEAATGIRADWRGAAHLGVSASGVFPQPGLKGAIVGAAEPGTAAAKGGMLPNDIITEFDGSPIPDWDALIEAIKKTDPGQKVSATVLRQGEPVRLEITMEGWPE